MVDNGLTLTADELTVGDLIFWSYEQNRRFMNITHVGIYAGNGKIIDASSSRGQVVYRNDWAEPDTSCRAITGERIPCGRSLGDWCFEAGRTNRIKHLRGDPSDSLLCATILMLTAQSAHYCRSRKSIILKSADSLLGKDGHEKTASHSNCDLSSSKPG
ncbi:C40 family peptidase [Cohnella sp. LGH]|uniref:NlpC/P60 family protein n=1 Tax=Cohnella sp. LGH TaxID=1619153 RepID=UPI001ADB3300|nr:C40 family peptidase [Cohnella sp. LGH]